MMKPNGYDEAKAKEFGEFPTLPTGNYICKILKAVEGRTASGKPKITLDLDIAEGEYRHFYLNQFSNDTRPTKKWGCQFHQLTEDNFLPFFKGVITAIEKSNKNFQFDFDENKLVHKFVGGQFGLEEYLKNDGSIGNIVKCRFLRSLEALEGAELLEDKKIIAKVDTKPFFVIDETLDDEELPF